MASAVKLDAIANWSFGYPYQGTARIPGRLALVIGIAAVAFLAIAALWRLVRGLDVKAIRREGSVEEGLVLAGALALATPVAEAAILLAGGTDLLGARNLNLASGGFAVLLSGLAAVASPLAAAVGVSGVLAVFGVATAKSLDSAYTVTDFHAADAFIDEHAGPHDVVADMESTRFSPVPLTAIQAQMSVERPVYNLYQPSGPPPFLTASVPPAPILKRALQQARAGRLYLVAQNDTVTRIEGGIAITLPGATVFRSFSNPSARQPTVVVKLPGWHLVESRRWPGVVDVNVFVLSPPPRG